MPSPLELSVFGGLGRRKHHRNVVLGRLSVHIVSRSGPAIARDVSQGGFSIETMQAIEAGRRHRVKFRFLTSLVEAEATCVHCAEVAPSGFPIYLAGFQFDQLDPASSALIATIANMNG